MRKLFFLFAAALCLFGEGCDPKVPQKKAELPAVKGIKVGIHSYNPANTVIAEVKPADEVNLVARVEGFLRKRRFVEGSWVKKGDLLYEIEPELYQAKVKAAQAKLTKARVAGKNADTDYKRQRKLLSSKAVSERTFDRIEAAKLEADADIRSAEAELEIATQNLSYTKIRAPFDGIVGLSRYSEGNLVGPSSGTLATIVKNDVVRVEFVVPELLVLNVFDKKGGKRDRFKIELITQDGKVYPYPGKISFWDNKVNTNTGTFRIQAEFPNPKGTLTAGMFGRIRITSLKDLSGVMIPEEALMVDQAGEYVYVVSSDGTVSRRNVSISYRDEGFAVVKSGVKAGETIIDAGIQHVRPGGKCKVLYHEMAVFQQKSVPAGKKNK